VSLVALLLAPYDPMLELLSLSPLFAVIVGALVTRFVIRRPFRALGWSVIAALAVGAFFLPLAIGVWIPDFIGTSRTLATATSSSGYSFRVTQAWNYCDFYSTTLCITAPDGRSTNLLLDGDDKKSWSVPIILDESKRTVTVTLGHGRPKIGNW